MTGKYKKYNGMTRKDLIDSVILWTEIYDKSFNNYISLSKRHDDLKDKYTEVTAQEAMDKINFACNIADELANGKQWIDLDIDNLPDRFFTRDDIEIEWLRLKHDNAVYDIWEIANEARHIMIGNIQKYSTKYRYRLKPLESIRITRDIVKKYNIPVTEEIFEIPKEQQERNCGILDNRFVIDGRKVEIID